MLRELAAILPQGACIGLESARKCDLSYDLTERASTSDLVAITAKRLDSEDVEEAVVEVRMPQTESAQQAQLIELVHARYPEAEFRSFANEAASFLAHKVLVVAVYRRASDPAQEISKVVDETQQRLFAA